MPQQSQFDRYLIISEVGRGGMATVYRAYDPRFKREVALKVLPAVLLEEPGFRERFEREAQVIASLEHSAIVPVYDFGEAHGRPYLVMRLMTGGSLADRLENGPLTLDEIVRILQRLAPALDAAHQHGIIHRDLKPANILFDQYNDPHLADFGIVKLADRDTTQSLTITGSTMGTPAYMSPEQVQGGKLDGRSDVYSLGIVLFEMLAGKRPYEATTPLALAFKHVLEPIPPLPRSDLPSEYQAVVNKALAKSPDQRYATASALAADVQTLTSRQSSPTHHPPTEYPATEVIRPLFAQTPPVIFPVVTQSALQATKIAPEPDSAKAIAPPITHLGRGREQRTWLLAVGGLIGLIFCIFAIAILLLNPNSDNSTDTNLVAAETTQTAIVMPSPTLNPDFPPRNAQLGDRWTRPSDGMVMVFVPASTFLMGSDPDQDPEAESDEWPQHEVTLSGFWLDRTEVTNAQFTGFVAQTGYTTSAESEDGGWNYLDGAWQYIEGANWQQPQGLGSSIIELADHPVVLLSWDDAHAYCVWAGGMLPTEAQWEYAARGDDGRLYVWGNTFDGTKANFCDANCPFDHRNVDVDDGYERTAPVGTYSTGSDSWVGAADMAGNASEWVADWYGGYPATAIINPIGLTSGDIRVLRGGSWFSGLVALRVADRRTADPAHRSDLVGFRCIIPPGG